MKRFTCILLIAFAAVFVVAPVHACGGGGCDKSKSGESKDKDKDS